jgi:hypothetical protein
LKQACALYIVTRGYNKLLWALGTNKPKRKKRKNKKRKQCQERRIDENEDEPQLLCPPKNSHHAPSSPKRRVPSNTYKKENDNNDTTARTNPRVSLGTLRGMGKRYTRHPSRRKDDTRKRHHVSVKAAGISLDLQNTTPRMIRSSTILAIH